MSDEFENEIAVVLARAIEDLQVLVASLQREMQIQRAELEAKIEAAAPTWRRAQ